MPIEVKQDESVKRGESKKDLTLEGFVRLKGGRGFANAELIMLPVTPAVLLAYGPRGRPNFSSEVQLTGAEAHSFAEELNRLMTSSAIDWVAARPGHPSLDSMNMLPPQPLLTVHDYGSTASARVNSIPARRPIRRLRHEDILEVAESEQA
ncbi:hypothetical protein [Arthrobacter humicola]|uniref:hypothetical protein n=1 Tax=Arthrobacter humicola TaxID=409291 RepID=UPI001FAD049A|nr:hypothetical protein [Arthrobacter humicola]MCI9870517.1 hypothetical protein [Arthrobacter humicola]